MRARCRPVYAMLDEGFCCSVGHEVLCNYYISPYIYVCTALVPDVSNS